jgi:hypothetical protein
MILPAWATNAIIRRLPVARPKCVAGEFNRPHLPSRLRPPSESTGRPFLFSRQVGCAVSGNWSSLGSSAYNSLPRWGRAEAGADGGSTGNGGWPPSLPSPRGGRSKTALHTLEPKLLSIPVSSDGGRLFMNPERLALAIRHTSAATLLKARGAVCEKVNRHHVLFRGKQRCCVRKSSVRSY